MKKLRTIWLFIRIVGRDFHGVRIGIKTAWNVSKQIWQ